MKPISNIESSELIKKWLQAYGDELFTWAFYKTSDKEKANDLVQDTFLKAFHNIANFEENSEPKTWLFAILNNLIIDEYRSKKKDPLKNLEDEFFDRNDKWLSKNNPKYWSDIEQESLLNDQNFVRVFDNCIGNLPETWEEVIKKKYIENKKVNLICQELKISASNYWQMIHRAKIKLRACLEKEWFKH